MIYVRCIPHLEKNSKTIKLFIYTKDVVIDTYRATDHKWFHLRLMKKQQMIQDFITECRYKIKKLALKVYCLPQVSKWNFSEPKPGHPRLDVTFPICLPSFHLYMHPSFSNHVIYLERLSSTNFASSIREYFVPYNLEIWVASRSQSNDSKCLTIFSF